MRRCSSISFSKGAEAAKSFIGAENPDFIAIGFLNRRIHTPIGCPSDAPLYVLSHPDLDTNMTKGLEVLRNALIDAIAKGRTWALDPIDGTVNMTRGIPCMGCRASS